MAGRKELYKVGRETEHIQSEREREEQGVSSMVLKPWIFHSGEKAGRMCLPLKR